MFVVSIKYIFWVLSVMSLATCIGGFNLSPMANIEFWDPFTEKRSSYFGFSLVLTTHSIFVGAPRKKTFLERQRKVSEAGAIYKCSFQTMECNDFIFDDVTNTEKSKYIYNSANKDNEWLGASMDGGPQKNDHLVVCAPRRFANSKNNYLVHGVCFWTTDTMGDRPIIYKKISPLRVKTNQMKKISGKRYFYHMFGEQGISVHLTENNEEIIIGAPGIHTWKGSIIRYRSKIEEDIGGFSRRDNRVISRRVRDVVEFFYDIPSPESWGQANDSYFGYAVSSGYFEGHSSKKLLYLATAPQANSKAGEAYLFDIIKSGSGAISIQKHYVFDGSQFGEYFGYSVITEDLNGDNLTDVIISAPQYAVGLSYENGAVYVFMNKGNLEFETAKLILGNSDKPGRFGTTLSTLGDINQDGYKDIAISAPFEDNGAVYIYLGSAKGLRDKPSQILNSPILSTQHKPYMFGHGLSKGVDFDGNGFNDLAVGAPNAETVLIYKAYPVVKIVASIESESKVLSIDQNKVVLKYCYKLKTASKKILSRMVSFKISADSKLNRVKFPTGSNEFQFNKTVTRQMICRTIDANLRFNISNIFKPIDLEMSYDVLRKAPNSENSCAPDTNLTLAYYDYRNKDHLDCFGSIMPFCKSCVAVDPMDQVSVSQRIVFSTGCKSDICVADLRLSSIGVKSPYVIGSTKTITVKYQISNEGEVAYLPQINVRSSNKMPFAKIPPACNQNDTIILCDLNQGRPLRNGEIDTFEVTFDTTNIDGQSLEIFANVFSIGDEKSLLNNEARELVILEHSSEIESVGVPVTQPLTLESNSGIQRLVNTFEVRNNGPSRIPQMDIIISIPTTYHNLNSDGLVLIDFNSISVNADHNNKKLRFSIYKNDVILLQNEDEESSSNMERSEFNSLQSTEKYPLEQNNLREYFYVSSRRRRTLEEALTKSQHAYESAQVTSDLIRTFPTKGTILFNCHNSEETSCVQVRLRVNNFLALKSFISIRVQYDIDLDKINSILIEPNEFFIITTSLEISEVRKQHSIQKIDPHNIISKHSLHTTPIWIYVVLVLGGYFFLVLICYGFYKIGFCKDPIFTTPIWIYIASFLGGVFLFILISYGLYELGFFRNPIYTAPIWLYILSILLGILIFLVISYGFYKIGFFRRPKLEELQRFSIQNQTVPERSNDEY